MSETDFGPFHLVGRAALKLLHDFHTLPDARGAEGMAAGQQPAVRVDRDLAPEVYFAVADKIA